MYNKQILNSITITNILVYSKFKYKSLYIILTLNLLELYLLEI
jgi:hypothetical protein